MTTKPAVSKAPAVATVEDLLHKARADRELTVHLDDGRTVRMRFEALGRPAYDALVLKHPPTQEQIDEVKEYGQKPAFNSDTFPVALIAASSAEPNLTEDDAARIYETWSPGELQVLWMAVFEVNNLSRLVELGKASNGTAAS